MRDILARAAAEVSASQCTPQWFIDEYFGHYAYPPHSKWQRINFLDGVASSDEGFIKSIKHAPRPFDAQTYTPRHLRQVHKNEIWSIFSSHIEWILSLIENHKDLKSKVNSHSWKIFFLTVSQLRQRALSDQDTNRRWGIKDETEEQLVKQPNLPSSLSNKDAATQPTVSKVKKAKTKKTSITVCIFILLMLVSFY
jgi:hypothetical protein